MSKIACPYELEAFDFGVASDFFYGHQFACSSAETAVNVQVCDYSNLNTSSSQVSFVCCVGRSSLVVLKNLSDFATHRT